MPHPSSSVCPPSPSPSQSPSTSTRLPAICAAAPLSVLPGFAAHGTIPGVAQKIRQTKGLEGILPDFRPPQVVEVPTHLPGRFMA